MPKKIKVDIFKSLLVKELYVYMESGSKVNKLPQELSDRLGQLQVVLTLDLEPHTKLVQANAVQVLKSLQEKGYYLQLPPKQAQTHL